MNRYIIGSTIQEILGAFESCHASSMHDTVPFAGVIQKFDTIPAAWGCVERIATLKALCCLKKAISESLAFLQSVLTIKSTCTTRTRATSVQCSDPRGLCGIQGV